MEKGLLPQTEQFSKQFNFNAAVQTIIVTMITGCFVFLWTVNTEITQIRATVESNNRYGERSLIQVEANYDKINTGLDRINNRLEMFENRITTLEVLYKVKK